MYPAGSVNANEIEMTYIVCLQADRMCNQIKPCICPRDRRFHIRQASYILFLLELPHIPLELYQSFLVPKRVLLVRLVGVLHSKWM